jgi:hypothetical protein
MRDVANTSDNKSVCKDAEMGIPAKDLGVGEGTALTDVKPSPVDPNAPTSSLTGNSPVVLLFSPF